MTAAIYSFYVNTVQSLTILNFKEIVNQLSTNSLQNSCFDGRQLL